MSVTDHQGSGRVAAQIADAVGSLHRRCYGRGPERAQTIIAEDSILVVLEGVSTTAERTLIAHGQHEAVHHMRRCLQESLREEMVDQVEALSGRRVRAFLSQACSDPDVAVEVFLLEPEA